MAMLDAINNVVSRQQKNSDNEKDPTFDLSKYHLIKPTYFTLIELAFVQKTRGSADVRLLIKYIQYFKHVPLSPAFLPTLRLLLDSYATHINTNPEFRLMNFITFAYLWLGNYRFDLKERVIQKMHTEDEENRVQFYLELSAEKSGKLWEVITMR